MADGNGTGDGEQRPPIYATMGDDEAVRSIGCMLHAQAGNRIRGKTWAEAHPQAMERLKELGVTPDEAIDRYLDWDAKIKARFAPENSVKVGDVPVADTRRADNPGGHLYMMEWYESGPTLDDVLSGEATRDGKREFDKRKREAERLASELIAVEESPTPEPSPDLDAIKLTEPDATENVAFPEIRAWLAKPESIVGKGRRILQTILDAGGNLALKDLNLEAGLDWGRGVSIDNAYNKQQRSINAKMEAAGISYELRRIDNAACLCELLAPAK